MDMYDGASEQEDLQATQLVHDLLAPGSSPMRSMELRNPLLRNLFAESNEISADSQLSSCASNSAPQYHFHGLASTQTQSQSQPYVEYMEVDMEEGSQKENIGAGKTTGKEVQQSMPSPRSPDPDPSQSKDLRAMPGAMSTAPINKTVTKKTNNVTFESPRHNSRVPASPFRAVTRQSPHKPGAMSTRHKPVPRPSSRASSVDSFARDPELDNAEERLIANAEQFNIPISELGKGSSGLDASDISGGISDQPKMAGRTRAAGLVLCPDSQESLRRSRSREEGPRSFTSDLQETQLYDPDATQLLVEHDPSGHSFESSQAQSDIAGFYGKRTVAGPVVKAVAETQVEELDESADPSEQTQPASQDEDEDEDEDEVRMQEQERREKDSILSMPATTFTTTSTGSGLINTVHSAVRDRYRAVQPTKTANEYPRQATSSSIVETQPSFPEAPPPKRSIPAPRLPLKKPPPIPRTVDPLDVVPDSEPLAPPEPARPQPQQASGPSKPSPAYTTPLLRKKAGGKGASGTNAAVNSLPVLYEEKRHDDDSEGEGSPLAAVVAKRPGGRPPVNSKGKGKEKAPAPEILPPTTVKEKMSAKPLLTRSVARNYADRSWETGVVPSSVPDQDVREAATRPTLDPPLAPAKPEKPPRSTSTAPKSKGKRVADEDDVQAEEQEQEDQHEEDEETGRNKRRKRAHPPSTTKPARNAAAAKRVKRGTTATPARSLRSESAKYSTSVEGTRVFALWPQDGHWYAGVVHSEAEEGRYLVHFDDTNRHCLRVSEMRLCDLRQDDEVLYDSLNRPARVVAVEGLRVMVELDGKTDWKAMRDLRIPNTTIRYGWDDRTLAKPDIVTTHSRQATATPSRPSAVGPSGSEGPKLKHLMGNTGFIITARDANEKDDIHSEIKRLGGHILDNFPTDVIDLKGQFSDKKNSWILSKKQAVWKGDRNTKRLFLIADDSLLTPKYLLALALGIPCVSQAWLTDSAESDTEKDWSTYLLPQGFSPSIGARLSQQVDADWGSSIFHLHRIMDNGVPSKLFKDMDILYIVSDSPGQKGQKKLAALIADDKAQPSYILLGMGAETVETVSTPTHASKHLNEYDYIVVRDNCSKHQDYTDYPKVVEWTWVKECLIASRILPVPVRDVVEA